MYPFEYFYQNLPAAFPIEKYNAMAFPTTLSTPRLPLIPSNRGPVAYISNKK